jgi:uncharacterized membrane protein YcfT
VSVIALPFFLLTLILSPAIACLAGKPICEAAKTFAKLDYLHLQLIPTSLLGIFSQTLAKSYMENCVPDPE